MANLSVGGDLWGEVTAISPQNEFPCMDSNYNERTVSFSFLKQFASYSAVLTYEFSTIPTYFSNRLKSVSYGGQTLSNYTLQSIVRKERISSTCVEYEAVFTKEDA